MDTQTTSIRRAKRKQIAPKIHHSSFGAPTNRVICMHAWLSNVREYGLLLLFFCLPREDFINTKNRILNLYTCVRIGEFAKHKIYFPAFLKTHFLPPFLWRGHKPFIKILRSGEKFMSVRSVSTVFVVVFCGPIENHVSCESCQSIFSSYNSIYYGEKRSVMNVRLATDVLYQFVFSSLSFSRKWKFQLKYHQKINSFKFHIDFESFSISENSKTGMESETDALVHLANKNPAKLARKFNWLESLPASEFQ